MYNFLYFAWLKQRPMTFCKEQCFLICFITKLLCKQH